MNGLLGDDKLDHKTEIQMAAILRFVLNNEDSLYLSDNLEKFLKKPFDFNLSSISSVSSFSDDSPVFFRRRIPEVQFLELTTVASNSVGSPIQDVLNTPQFQLRKLRRQLAQEQDVRDELERELANNSQLITERETQISQLQHRVQRLMRDHAEQEQDPRELEELQNKNEGLLKRLHEVLKQCQDLKTNKGQMERKIDQLTEENGNLSAQIRDIFARLASAHSMVDSLTEEQKTSQTDWESKKTFLEAELSRAVSEKECLSEQIQILQGKISILEDELRKAQTQTKEEGEVMGPIMEWERLHHEISELKCKVSQLQESIIQLEQEKAEIQMMRETEKTKNENEIIRFQGLISELQQALHTLQSEKEALEQTSREQWAAMTAQIEALNSEIACLSETVQQREMAVTSLGQKVAEEQRKRGELTKEMEKQEQTAWDTIQGLNQQVNHLGSVIKAKEEEALSNAMEWERDREESFRQQATLIEASENATRERDAILVEYHQFRQEKDDEISNLIQKVQQLEQQWEVELSLSSKLKNEREGLELKLTTLESAIRDLQNDLEVESRKHKETLAAKLQKDSQMAEEILKLGNRIQQLLTEINVMGEELNKSRQEKLHAESSVEKLTKEHSEVTITLATERDHILLKVKEREVEVERLSSEIEALAKKLALTEDAKAKEIAEKREEIQKLLKELEEVLAELEAVKMAKEAMEARLHSSIEKHQKELSILHAELEDMQGSVRQKETELELLQNEMSLKEREMKTQQEYVLRLENETAELDVLHKNLAEEERKSSMFKQEAESKDAEAQLLRTALAAKEDEIKSLLHNIQAMEERASALHDIQDRKAEEFKQSISVLELQLAEAQAQLAEKVTALETQSQNMLSLQEELSLEQAQVASLAQSLKASESSLRDLKMQEEVLREEARVYQEELKKQRGDFEELQQEVLMIQEEKRESESKVVAAAERIEQLEAEVHAISSLATEREVSLENLMKEFSTVTSEIKLLQERDIEKTKLANTECKRQEETIEKLHRDILSASTLATERQQEAEMLHMEVSSLKKELEKHLEKDLLKSQETNVLESQLKELEQKVAQLQTQVLEASSLSSKRESELHSLQNEVKEKDNLRLQAAEMEESQRKELEQKVAQLQAQVLEATTLASKRESELHSLQNDVEEKDNLRLQAAELEESQQKALEQKVSQLQAQVLEATTLASKRESELHSLQNEVKEKDNLRLQAAEMEEAQQKELEQKVAQLQAQVLEASSLSSKRESELHSLQNEVKEKDNLRLQVAEMEESQRKELEQKVAQLQAQVLEATTLASKRESELHSLQNEVREKDNLRLQAAEMEEAQLRALEQKVAQLQAQVLEASSLASKRESELLFLQNEVKEKDNLRIQAAEMEESQRKELEQKVAQLQAQVLEASTLASKRESELHSLQNEVEEKDNLRLQAAEMEGSQQKALEQKVAQLQAQRKELEQKVAQLQAQVLKATTLASRRESELHSLQNEVREKDNLRLQAAEMEEAQRRALEQKVAQLQAQVLEASSFASKRESELRSLQNEVEEKDNLRIQAAEMEGSQQKALEQKVAQLQAQVLEASSLSSKRESELLFLQNEVKEKDNLRIQAAEMEESQRKELEQKVAQLQAQVLEASSLASKRESELHSLQNEVEEKNNLRLQVAEMEESQRKQMEQKVAQLQTQTEALENQLQRAREELSKLRPFKEAKAEMLQVNCDLQEQLTAKSEALDHYKAQVEKAKNHYNGKKQQLLEMSEKAQALGTALENSEQEVKTLKAEKKRLLMELEQAKNLEKNLTLKVNSLQAQVDYADRQLREQTKEGRCDTLKTTTRECKNQTVAEKQQDISGDSLDLSLDDSLNATRRPSGREDSSTPVVRSSERLQAKRRARGGESLETLYFTPMSSREGAPCKLESSITSMGELTLDSAKKGHSARRRTTQVINITMTKKTPGSSEADPEDSSFYSLHSAQSFPNLASQRGRPISMDFSEENNSNDQLLLLPGYRRSTAHSIAPTRSTSTFGVDTENEPENTDDWMRIAELQTRNKACPPHLKSSYPIESRPSLGYPSFTITDDDLRTGDPNETIRRISMLPGQIRESSQFHRLSMLPGQISSGVASQSAVLRPKQSASNVQNTGGATLPLKRSSSDLPGPDTPEAKKISSCFPRPMTPKGRSDRRFVSHNSQNIPPNIPPERRQSMMFSIENTPKKNGKSSLLQKGINKMRGSTRKSPASTSKVPGSRKSPRGGKSPYGEKPQRRSPRVNSSKSPKIVSSAKKMMAYRGRMKV
ncbi:nuclear mitotic apparatus protein 1 [Megalops cyprinoides]|uniref:nuclear mitotic apparatus protein 1 n=1 Tax=Megalops cyprinoides TaxID=118141 RepID=UPI001865378A|nr:nuclear mitotic apparatus protein 1 [Megalops cyprinoides]